MGTFNSKCPHCGVLVEVQPEWINMEVECPECKERFVIQPPASPQFKLPRLDMPGRFKNTHASPGNTPPEEEATPQEDEIGDEISAGTKIALKHLFGGLMELRKTQYPWGRIYIALARIFAVLVLLAGLCIILNGFHDAFSKRRDLLEELQAESEKIIPRQEAFKEHFEQLAEIVLTGNQSEAKFQFPSDISTTENEFNESLMTEEDVQESLAATEDYAGKLKNMSDIMNQYFQMPARRIETELRKGDTLSITTTTGQNRDSSLDLKLSQNVDFFSMSDSDLREVIQAAFRELDELAASSSIDVKEEVMVLRRGLTFINQALCSKSTDLSVRGRSEQEQVSNIQVGRQKLWREVELLRSILEKLNALCRYDYQHNDRYLWQLSGELEQLKNVLLNHETEVKKTRREISRIFGFAGKAGVRQLIVSLILAFLIMVIADFLQAHLDSSDHLRKLCGRGMMLLTLLLLVGCGASPEDWLEEQKEALKTAAIDSMFYQAAGQNNPSATFYGRPGVELIVINGGISAHTRFPERTMGSPHLFAPIGFGRTYTIIRLKFSVSPESIKFNPVKKSNKAPYTHRTTMVLTAKQELVSRPDVFGLGIAALVPEGFDEWGDAEKEEWVKKYYGLLPSDDCDHALVIQNTPYTGSTETITRNFEILFNSKTKCWELGKQEKIESVAPIPEYSETQGEQLRLARGFKSITWTVKKNDPLVLYLQDADCEIIKKLNDGLLLVNGKWVDGETYWQTRRLGELMEKIRNDKELTWTKLEEFAVAVEENSLAKNRKKAVALVESYFESEIEINLENKEKLQYLVKKLQLRCFTIVNEEKRERLLEKCRSRLEEMAAAERDRARIEKLAAEKHAREVAAQKAAVRARLTEERNHWEQMKECIRTGTLSELEKILADQPKELSGGRELREVAEETKISGLVFFAELKDDLKAIGGEPEFSEPPRYVTENEISAIDFPGRSRQGIRYSWTPITGDQPRTVSLWFCRKKERKPGGGGDAIFTYGTKNFGRYFDIETNSDGGLYCAWGEPHGRYADDIPLGQWHHCAITYDGKIRRCYLDGQMTTETAVRLQTAASPLMIGTRIYDESHCFFGRVRNVAVYKRVLSGEELQRLRKGLEGEGELQRRYQTLRRLLLLEGKDADELNALAQNQWQIAGYDLRSICSHCQGKGKEPCNSCNSTGVCQICKGTGKKTEYRNIMDKKVIKQVPYTANCHKECIHCNGQSKPCKICKGRTGFLNGAAVKDAIEKVSSEFCAWLDTLIEETTKHIEELDRQIEELDRQIKELNRQNESTGA